MCKLAGTAENTPPHVADSDQTRCALVRVAGREGARACTELIRDKSSAASVYGRNESDAADCGVSEGNYGVRTAIYDIITAIYGVIAAIYGGDADVEALGQQPRDRDPAEQWERLSELLIRRREAKLVELEVSLAVSLSLSRSLSLSLVGGALSHSLTHFSFTALSLLSRSVRVFSAAVSKAYKNKNKSNGGEPSVCRGSWKGCRRRGCCWTGASKRIGSGSGRSGRSLTEEKEEARGSKTAALTAYLRAHCAPSPGPGPGQDPTTPRPHPAESNAGRHDRSTVCTRNVFDSAAC
eukprot:1723639-Rhodomonas_salina.1